MQSTFRDIENKANDFADKAADKADMAIDQSKRVASDVLHKAQDTVDAARSRVPSAIADAASRVEEMAKDGYKRACEVGADVKDRFDRAGDSTVAYIRDEPVKSVMIAAAAGAVIAAVVGLMARSRADR